ncbi:Clp protease N-terminal domain-containing protein [Amycolatopsis jiangsuensis]|uniref:ATP-dependent Clp protease ATP-binding subunit ClpA n=1 Tax=Amycolatopsis jiangsuensis TaxID=1181879 RepID=A0A840IZE5_9PSEU|nr:Clp protease N-terminal domain-containing protein [Amycolatopsis jiangsuensis]MBB4686667.1 ATP-dependent Clp protease ATP-binding subunit ClpA [Amycolatopsis jiangsuensis]
MFERFTRDARMAVVEAQEAAQEAGAREISAQAVFAGLVRVRDGSALRLLVELGVSKEDVDAELHRVARRGGISDSDAEALTELGIDVDQIVQCVEQAHGPGALAGPRRRSRRSHLRFTDDAKRALESSVLEAVELGGKDLGQEHLLLALVRQRGPVADFLATRGVDYAALRRAITQAG